MAEIKRRKTLTASIGGVRVGSNAPVMVQSMTNTDTADIPGTIKQVAALARAGSEVVRVTVNDDDEAIPHIVEGLAKHGLSTPIVGDFHYNGRLLLNKFPGCAEALAKYRINPGNVSIGRKNDDNFRTMIECAIENGKPVRIGVNWGSLDQALLARMMDANAKLASPQEPREVMIEAMIVSALHSAELAENMGSARERHSALRESERRPGPDRCLPHLASRCEYALHLGLTEAGMGAKGIVTCSTAGRRFYSRKVSKNTIRVSLPPVPEATAPKKCRVAQQILQSLGIRSFLPQVTACPGCDNHLTLLPGAGRSRFKPICASKCQAGESTFTGVEEMKLAVIGCVVNGPESPSTPVSAFRCRERLKTRRLRCSGRDGRLLSPRSKVTRLSPSSPRFSTITSSRTMRYAKRSKSARGTEFSADAKLVSTHFVVGTATRN